MNRSEVIKERQSEVRALEKEYFDLRSAYYSREWIKLDKPIRDGWWKHLKIKDALVETKNGKLYQTICEAVTLKVGGTLKEDCEKRWQRILNRQHHIRLPGIQGVNKKQLKKLPPAARKHFLYYGHRIGYRGEKVFMCMLSHNYFEETFSRAYITHRLPVDSVTVRRLDEIEQLLLSDKYYKYSWKAYSYRWREVNSKQKERHKIKVELKEHIKIQNQELLHDDYTFIEST